MSKSPLYQAVEAFRDGTAPEQVSSFNFEIERQNRSPRFIEIVRAYAQGISIQSITETHKCSKNTVLRYARLAGLPKRPKHFDDSIRSQVIELLRIGMPIAEIATRVNVSQAYVSITAKEAGLSRYKKETV